jgi:hypothetical protein
MEPHMKKSIDVRSGYPEGHAFGPPQPFHYPYMFSFGKILCCDSEIVHHLGKIPGFL